MVKNQRVPNGTVLISIFVSGFVGAFVQETETF